MLAIRMEWRIPIIVVLVLIVILTDAKRDKYGGNGKDKFKAKNMDLYRLALQLRMQQFYTEEATRTSGHSGLKVMRHRMEGTQPYHGTSHSDDFTMGATHDHSDFVNTCGMGEVAAVLNGIFWVTRHNDYLLNRKADNDGTLPDYDAKVNIPYPDVPNSVIELETIDEQIIELRKYFEAFHKQNSSIRDYAPYFKPHLCYMEGAWTKSDPDEIQEAFFSERHFYEAFSWDDMMQKKRYESYSGTKLNLENFAFMPSTLWEVEDDGTLVFGQWNYRILCHQLKNDLPLNRLRAVDDLKTRMSLKVTYEEAQQLRNARYQINPNDQDKWIDGTSKWSLLDRLFEEIPGTDGYNAELIDDAFNNLIKRFDAHDHDETPLNANQYHRWFQNLETGAMGAKVRHRGFSDEHMWVAMTTQPNVLGSRLEMCNRHTRDNCQSWELKWTYAMPMEIIYTTPLHNWNPHNIKYHGLESTDEGKVIYGADNTRNGNEPLDQAFNGTNSGKFYHTPWAFFEGNEFGEDPADTPSDFVYVLNEEGNESFKVRSTGVRTFMPSIPGMEERIRQRYPIHMIHGEGSPVWKELSALKEIVMDPKKFAFMVRDANGTAGEKPLQMKLGPSSAEFHHHTHLMTLSESDLDSLDHGHNVTVVTEQAHGHQHPLVIEQDATEEGDVIYRYVTCSGLLACPDGHPAQLQDP